MMMQPPAPGPPVEKQIAFDMIRRSARVAPLLVVGAGLGWGLDGALSSAYAIVLVLVNFALSAGMLSWAARVSLGMLMGTALFGYLLRLALVFVAVYAVKDAAWVDLVPLGFTIVVTHLGLLIWETRYVSASLAFPALKPTEKKGVEPS
jgi:hypothetical protein